MSKRSVKESAIEWLLERRASMVPGEGNGYYSLSLSALKPVACWLLEHEYVVCIEDRWFVTEKGKARIGMGEL